MHTRNTQTKPQSPESSEKARCASCGQFVGPYTTCPYCGAKIEGRISLRLVKWAAVLLATLGLVGLWGYARATDIPTLSVVDAQGTMNMAYIRIAGRVVRSRTYDPESQYFAFWLDDGTGEVRVSAYRDVTESLMAEDRLPALGDEVQVAGTLRIREDYVALTLNVPEHLIVTRPPATPVQAGELTLLDEYLRVQVAGEVARLHVPYEGLTLVTIRDTSGEVTLTIDETTLALADAPLPEILETQGIQVAGTVTLYKDTPQITLSNLADLVLSDAPPEEALIEVQALSSITSADAGARVRVQGHIVAMEGFKGGLKATLDDSVAQRTLLLWENVYASLAQPTHLDIGADVEVTGEVHVYQDEVEIVPEAAADITILAPASEIPWVAVGDLSALDAGRLVRVRGVLEEPKGFSAGVKVMLNDGTGKIIVLLWSNIATQLTPAPVAGLPVEVVGLVDVYQKELELIPRSSVDWRAE